MDDSDDDDWVESAKKFPRRRSKSIASLVKTNAEVPYGPKTMNLEMPSEEAETEIDKSHTEICCS